MKKTSKLSRFFKFTWDVSKDADPNWDSLLNTLIDKAEVTHIDEYAITFDDKYVVWITNHPYCSGSLYELKGVFSRLGDWSSCFHCSKKTKIRLEDFVNENFPEEDDEVTKVLKSDLGKYSRE